MEEKTNVLNDLTDAFRFMGEGEIQPDRAEIYKLMGYTWRQVAEAHEKGKPVAWLSWGVPPEPFWAMDVVPLVDLVASGILALLPKGHEYIDLSRQHVPEYLCTANTCFVGVALAGDIPLANMVVHQAHPCDSALATGSTMPAYFGLPHFSINVPYVRNERGIQYTVQELRKLFLFLEEHTGRKLDFDRLHQVMEYSNLADEYMLELNELTAQVPCPPGAALVDRQFEVIPWFHLSGTPQLVDYLKRTCEKIKARVDRKEKPEREEKIRLAWTYLTPGFAPGLFNYLEEEYGAVSLSQMVNNIQVKPADISDFDKILRALAEKTWDMPMAKEFRGLGEYYIDGAVGMCRYYKADGAVCAGHHACKSGWAIAKLTKDKIEDELNIPALNFELDIMDDRYVSADDVQAKLEDFVTLILQRKASRSKL